MTRHPSLSLMYKANFLSISYLKCLDSVLVWEDVSYDIVCDYSVQKTGSCVSVAVLYQSWEDNYRALKFCIHLMREKLNM